MALSCSLLGTCSMQLSTDLCLSRKCHKMLYDGLVCICTRSQVLVSESVLSFGLKPNKMFLVSFVFLFIYCASIFLFVIVFLINIHLVKRLFILSLLFF